MFFRVCSNKHTGCENAERNGSIARIKIVDKLLFIFIYLRKAVTQDVLGELFGVSQPVANKCGRPWGVAISRARPLDMLRILRLTIKFQIIFFQDSTERPIQRFKDPQRQKAYYSGQKKQHTHKNNLVIDAVCKVELTPTCEGRIHDRIADATGYCLKDLAAKRNPKDETRLKKKRGISVSESNM